MDYQSTTPVDKRVLDEMMPYFSKRFGNAASKSHEFGWTAERAVEIARGKTADLISCNAKEIIFTSGATESNNLAIKGIAEYSAPEGKKIIIASTEHKSVIDTCSSLAKKGFEIIVLQVDRFGLIDLDDLRKAIDDNTILVSIMYANNEIGTLQPVNEIGNICKEKNVLFHCDAVQAAGKIKVDVNEISADLISLSAHKFYGPKGIGALYIRSKKPKLRLISQIDGGGHERGFRSGTLNVPAIVGFGKACELALSEMEIDYRHTDFLRSNLINGFQNNIENLRVNGHPENHLPNNLNICIKDVDADALMMSMKEIAVSSGSACSSASVEPSHVLKAIGLSEQDSRSSIRIGLGRNTTEEEVNYCIEKIAFNALKLRKKNLFLKILLSIK
jgi:cysteine desulfurase